MSGKTRGRVQSELRLLLVDQGALREQLEEEQEARGDAQRALTRLQQEAGELRRRADAADGDVSQEALDELQRRSPATGTLAPRQATSSSWPRAVSTRGCTCCDVA